MDNTIIAKKIIQKALLNELCNQGVVDFTNISPMIKKLDEDIHKLSKLQVKDANIQKMIVKIPV